MGTSVRRIAVLAVVLGTLAACAGAWWGVRRDDVHKATTVVLVNPMEGNPFNPDGREGLLNLETEARLVTSDAVARAVAQDLPKTKGEVLAGVSVEVPPNTQLLKITVEDVDPGRARLIAAAVAKEYLAYRSARTEATVFDRRAHLTEEVRTMKAELTELATKQAGQPVGSPRRALLDQQVAGLVAQVAQVQSEQTALGYVSQDPGQVVTPATIEGRGPIPGVALGAGAGAVLGIGIAALVGLAAARRHPRVGSLTDVVAAGHEVLASGSEPDVARARILMAQPSTPLVLLVADVTPDPSSVPRTADRVGALAASFGRAKLQTIHLDLRSAPREGEALLGLADVMLLQLPPEKGMRKVDDYHSVMLLGHWQVEHGGVGDLLASPGFATLLGDLRDLADVVLISGVRLPHGDEQVVLAMVDSVVLWVTPSGTTYPALDAAEHLVASSPATLAGLVHDALPAGRPWARRR